MSVTIPCDYCHLPVRIRGASDAARQAEPVYCCYGCSFAARITHQKGERGQATWMLTRLGLAGFLSMVVMIFSIFLYGREIYETEAGAAPISTHVAQMLRYASLLVATPVLFLLGVPILRNAASQWRAGVVSTDALVVLGVASAYVYSYIATIRESGATYFETACMILVLVTLGRWFEAVGRIHATERVRSLESLLPAELRVRRGGTVRTVLMADVRTGDTVLVSAGDRIAVDGRIAVGRAGIDEQIVTGESTPVVRQAGDVVRAGTMNLDGELEIVANAVGAETTLGRLKTLLEQARASKGRYERLADRVVVFFLPITLCLAGIAAYGGHLRGGADEAIMSALSVLLIACPCGLGIATPMAVWMSLSKAALAGAVFRTGEAIEKLARVRTFFFDKTGTLTIGSPRVSSLHAAPGEDRHRVMGVAGVLASRSRHLASQAVVTFAGVESDAPELDGELRTIAGRGVVCMTSIGEARLGNVAMMEETGWSFDGDLRCALDAAMAEGRGVACIGWAGRVRGVFALDEAVRPEARSAIDALRALGCRVSVLTGDHARRGEVVAEALGVETHAALLPEDKVRFVETAPRSAGLVAMVGDGLNDAAAAAAADVGIAMGCGADMTRESAAVCLPGNDLMAAPRLVALARRTVRTIRVNLFWAFFYNAIGLALAVSGRLSPVFAAVAMVASSLFVIGNSLRLGAAATGASPPGGGRATPSRVIASPEAAT